MIAKMCCDTIGLMVESRLNQIINNESYVQLFRLYINFKEKINISFNIKGDFVQEDAWSFVSSDY